MALKCHVVVFGSVLSMRFYSMKHVGELHYVRAREIDSDNKLLKLLPILISRGTTLFPAQ